MKLYFQARINKETTEKLRETIHDLQKTVYQKISLMERNNNACNDLAENLKTHNALLENENRSLKKKVSDMGTIIKKLEKSINSDADNHPPTPTSIPKTVKSTQSTVSLSSWITNVIKSY